MTRKYMVRVFYALFIAFNLTCCALWSLDPARHFGSAIRPSSSTPEVSDDTQIPPQGVTYKGDAPHSGDDTSQEQGLPAASDKSRTSFNALVLGLDDGGTRTDAVMLANIDPVNRKATILSIPRDTLVPVPGVGMTKINHAHYWGQSHGGNRSGTKLAVEAVEGLLGCDIRYYVKVDFEGYKSFIDTVGGVDIDLPHEVVVNGSDKTFPAGPQHLDGETALILVRQRFTLPDGDFGRQRLQYLVISSLAQKLLRPEYIPRLPSLASQVMNEVVDTNLSVTDVLSLAMLFEGMTASDITYLQVPGTETYALDPLVGKELYYWLPDALGLKELAAVFGPSTSDGPEHAAISP
jgi:LCP family protein required for cell wall assembly